jgi:GNAT superfamily N-acetyltransferase
VIEVRAVSPETPEASGLLAALLAELADMYGPGVTVPYAMSVFLPPEGHFALATDDGTAVGCGGFIRFDAATAELKRMYVLPALRGRGLGRLLLSHLESSASAAGYARMVLETGDKQLEALELYRRCGYGVIPCYPPYNDRGLSICMARSISAAPA